MKSRNVLLFQVSSVIQVKGLSKRLGYAQIKYTWVKDGIQYGLDSILEHLVHLPIKIILGSQLGKFKEVEHKKQGRQSVY